MKALYNFRLILFFHKKHFTRKKIEAENLALIFHIYFLYENKRLMLAYVNRFVNINRWYSFFFLDYIANTKHMIILQKKTIFILFVYQAAVAFEFNNF